MHPLNILSMSPLRPQNHSNVSLSSPPPSDPGSACPLSGLSGASVAKGGAAASLELGGPLGWYGYQWHVLPSSGLCALSCFPGVSASASWGSNLMLLVWGMTSFFSLFFGQSLDTTEHGAHSLGTHSQI